MFRAIPLLLVLAGGAAGAVHNPGLDCLICHSGFSAAGTVFAAPGSVETAPRTPVVLTAADGARYAFETDAFGNLAAAGVPAGRYLARVAGVASRTWHTLPGQAGCNSCHRPGGNGSDGRPKAFPVLHTQIPADNDCRNCHHFPASQAYAELRTSGVLNAAAADPPQPGSRVDILGRVFEFDPEQYDIRTCRPDIFAPGFYSMFDVIVAVARAKGIRMSVRFDPARMTHFIHSIDGRTADYWYHFSYDAGSGNAAEIAYRRANRWDEALWRPGVWIKVVSGEDLAGIKTEYLEEIARERSQGHVIPSVQISLNPSNFRGNPPGSDRITVTRQFANVKVSAHDWRATGFPTPYPKPFRPGVVTALDVLLSLRDQGALNAVTGAFYTFFGGNSINSYYVVELGFPGIGTAHASGRQGFIYVTENGTPNALPNKADGKLHITSDIAVVHAPDFATWRWAELGNPYYEKAEPRAAGLFEASIAEDFEAIDRGFSLHSPLLRPPGRGGGGGTTIEAGCNIFEPGRFKIELGTGRGRVLRVLHEGPIETIGIRRIHGIPDDLPPGDYRLIMNNGRNTQVRSFTLD